MVHHSISLNDSDGRPNKYKINSRIQFSSSVCYKSRPKFSYWALFVIMLILGSLTTSVDGGIGGNGKKTTNCLRNCHLCQQMYGTHFQGQLCAHTCVKLRGRLNPDCTDLVSIAPYLDLTNVV